MADAKWSNSNSVLNKYEPSLTFIIALTFNCIVFRTTMPPEQEEIVLIKEVETEPQEELMIGMQICRVKYWAVFLNIFHDLVN